MHAQQHVLQHSPTPVSRVYVDPMRARLSNCSEQRPGRAARRVGGCVRCLERDASRRGPARQAERGGGRG